MTMTKLGQNKSSSLNSKISFFMYEEEAICLPTIKLVSLLNRKMNIIMNLPIKAGNASIFIK